MNEGEENCDICILWIERYIDHRKIYTLEDAYQVYNLIAKMTGDKFLRVKRELKFIIEELGN
jgi:hypothetical protein